MRRLYPILIYTTVALGIATIWALGKDLRAREFLERARQAAAVPFQPTELEAAGFAAAAAADDGLPCHHTPATHPAPVEASPIRRAAQADTGDLVP